MSQSISLYKQLANHKLFNKTINFDLTRIKLVLKKLNHPEKKLKNVINFLGSSGKFTTLHSIKSFIEANNQTVTAYISPSIKDIKERFWMGDRHLTHQEIKQSIELVEKVKDFIDSEVRTKEQVFHEQINVGKDRWSSYPSVIDELKEKMYTYSSDEFEGKDTPSSCLLYTSDAAD